MSNESEREQARKPGQIATILLRINWRGQALEEESLIFEGVLHRGIDDAKSIAHT